MRIKSITARNYKLHREISVELDPACTVIGGPNECGKSTLAEAAHRAFFLKAKITGEAQKSMVSFVPSGQPEVELCFETGTRSYRLFKRFSGQTGMTRLAEIGGASWTDEAAEDQLARILGVEPTGGGRGAGERAAQQWAHLWVWQGQAGNDPAEQANAQKDTLMSRLQVSGGAAVMQSELDARVARYFTERFETIFNRNGSPKANSDLARAVQKELEATALEAKAREIFNRLQQAITDHEQAQAAIVNADQSLSRLAPQKAEVERKLKLVEELRHNEQVQSAEAEAVSRKHKELADASHRIEALGDNILRRTQALEPKHTEATRLRDVADEKGRASQTASASYDTATEATRTVRLHRDLSAAFAVLLEKTGQYRQFAEKADLIRREQQARSGLETDLARLPQVDTAKLKKLQKLEVDRSNAESALKAMAARIEVISSTTQVKAGENILTAGVDHLISEDTELTIGDTVRLRIKPGGGTSLADAREYFRQAKVKLQAALDHLGLASLEAAAEALAIREKLQGQIRIAETRLTSMGANSIDAEVSAAQMAINNAQGEVERRRNQVPDFKVPTDLPAAVELTKRLGETVQEKELIEKNLRDIRDQAAEVAERTEKAAIDCRAMLDKESQEIGNLKVEQGVLTRIHGDDDARSLELIRLHSAKISAEQQLSSTRAALDNLQPDLLNADRTRLDRAFAGATQDKSEADRRLAVAKHTLASDGTADPAASLATAEAQLKSAREQLQNEQRRAKAVQMLHDLFLEEQRKLSQQITRPLVEKVSGYLQCLFGARTQAIISLEQNHFLGLQITRPGRENSACQFELLSGGAREQVAAAFRMAMAEVLAASHDGCLPLLFDDAFAYSDPERVQTLQRMLDLAAKRGLQIIVLTCNPLDYAALGAKQITLTTVAPTITPPPLTELQPS
jgi:recombinational DNA repair ATPase RecF